MSLIATIWRNIEHWWHGTESKYGVSIDQYPKEKVVIGIGGSIKLSAHVTTSSPESFIRWQKVESHGLQNIQTDSIKYSRSSCSMPNPELVINNVDKTDDGVYQLSVTTITGTVTGQKVLLSVFGDPVVSLPKEGSNFIRFYLLCQKIATESVRLYFTRKVPEPTLASHLHSYKTNLKFSHWKCTSDQITVLFPAAPGHAKSSNFDFSLLYKLIRNTITPVSTPTRGWGQNPSPNDIREEDDIERIRHTRNLLAHNTDFQLSDSDFNNLWTDLSQAICRLSLGSLKAHVNKLADQKLDQQLRNEKFENLKKGIEIMKSEISILHQDMEECREKILTIEDTHIPPNIRRTQLKLLKVWKKDDELYYNSTNVYQASKDKIESFPSVALVGGPGCGKTATARHIALQYEQNGWEIVPVFRPEEIVLYGDLNLKQIFVLDDILGVFAVDMSMYNNINNHKEGILNAISNESKLLFTCRKYVYNEAINLKSFVLTNIVDLQSEENLLNESEKENILAKHCRHKGVPENIYCNPSISSSFTMFPLLCKIFSATYKNHVSVDNFFANPFHCFIDELNKLEQSTPQNYAALVLCVLSNNMLAFDKVAVDENKMKLDAYNTCGINKGTSDKLIKNALSNLVGTYLLENENNFSFIHGAIYEITAYHYGKTNPQMILKYMKSNFISTKVTVIKNQRNDVSADSSILIDEKYYEQLAERLYTDLQSLELFDVFMCKSLRHVPFLKIFIKTLKEKPYNELKTLICHEQLFSRVLNIGSNIDQNTDRRTEKYKEQIRQELLKNVYTDAREPHNPRIISWIIYYGHTNILTNIVSLVKEHNDSTDILFGSDIYEQTRILILGCYSGNDDMVNVILKHVKIDCINKTSFDKNLERELFSNMHRIYTPLTSACTSGKLSVVQILLKNNANMELCDDFQRFPLLTASEYGHNDIVEYLVQEGGNVNQCNENNVTCLFGASYNGHYNIVKYLIQQGANVNQCASLNQSPLYAASLAGHSTIVEFLVENGADVNKCDVIKKSPLYQACVGGYKAIVKCLVKHGANVHQSCTFDISPLYIACQSGYTSIVEFLVENGANVNQCKIFGEGPLFAACQSGHKAVAEFLVENGADVHESLYVRSPLYSACEGGHKAVVEFLVERGANVNQCDSNRRSLVYIASAGGHIAVVKFLVEKGVDVHKCNKNHQSPLYKACEGGHIAVVEFLVEHGANTNHCDTDDQSPLYIASAGGHIAVVEFLVEKGVDVHKCNKNHQSPLYKACEGGHIAVVEFLVEHGANTNYCDTDEQSPLYKASERGHKGVVEFLVKNGADVYQCDILQKSILYIASAGGHTAIVQFLVEKGVDFLRCCKNDQSPLYKASEGGHKGVVEFLVKNGADVNQSDRLKKSPLYKASEGRHQDVFEFRLKEGEYKTYQIYKACKREYTAVVVFLVTNGADVNQLDTIERSPLYIACQGGHKDVVEFLVENGADINQCNEKNQSPLHKACEGGHIAIVKCLVENGADVNQCDMFKKSPLNKADEKGHKSIVEFLKKNGADVNNGRNTKTSIHYIKCRKKDIKLL